MPIVRLYLAGDLCLWLALGLSLFAIGATRAAGPTVIWASSPVQPGETVLLFGDGFVPGAEVTAWPTPAGVAGTPGAPSGTPSSGGVKLEIRARSAGDTIMAGLPAKWAPGVYALRVVAGGQSSAPLYLNRPRLEWWLGDQPEAVSPGATLRLFGRNLRLVPPGQILTREQATSAGYAGRVLLVDSAGKSHALALSRADRYALTAQVPGAAAAGPATVLVHAGTGGAFGWSDPLAVQVEKARPWPETVYNVRALGAKGDGAADDTEAVRAALQAAAEAGGGVVLFPRGTYRITAQLNVPPRTTVRGEGADRTWLYVPAENTEFNAVFAGSGDFAIERLWLSAQTTRRLIAAPDEKSMYAMPWGGAPAPDKWASNVHLRDLRLHHLRYAHRVGGQEDPRREESVGPSTVVLCGAAMEITNCNVVSSGMPLVLMNSSRSLVRDNVFGVGRSGWYGLWGARELCFEGNEIVGRDLEASYGGFNGDEVARIYFADTRFHGSFGCEREALTFDAPGRYGGVGAVAAATETSLTAASHTTPWKDHDLRVLGCLIIAGKGRGQMRQIIGNVGEKLTLEGPWDVVPDATSLFAVRPYRTQVTLYRNYSEDTSVGIQLWSGGHDFLIEGNTSIRTGGLWGCAGRVNWWGDMYHPCYFTQWLNNRIEQGFIYQQGPGLFATLGLYCFNTASPAEGDGTPVLANVLRGNEVHDQTRIGLFYYGGGDYSRVLAEALAGREPFREPPGRANLIELNRIANSAVGVEIQACFADTLVRENRCTDVAQPLLDTAADLPKQVTAAQVLRAEVQAEKGPIVWYTFERLLPDGRVPNQAREAYAAQPVGMLTREAGRLGQAARFDGQTYLQAGETGDLSLLALNLPRYTVAAWIKPDDVTGRWGLVARRLRNGPAPLVFCVWNQGLALDATNEESKWVFNSTTPPCLKVGEWQHVAMSVDQEQGVEFYVNGVRVGGRQFQDKLAPSAEPLIIGREQWGGNPPAGSTPGVYRGLMDDIKLWSRVLTPDEIKQEFAAAP